MLCLLTIAAGCSKTSIAPVAGKTSTAVLVLAKFPDEKVGIWEWMKHNAWASKRHSPEHFEIGNGRMRLVSHADSVMIGTKRGFPVDPNRFSRIRFTIRVDQNPTGTDPSKKSGDDAAFRLYVAFDRGGGFLTPPNSIAYCWTEKPVGPGPTTSPYYDSIRNLAIGHGRSRGKDGAPGFVTIERDLLADYKTCFPEDDQAIPMLAGVMVKCDANNTRTSAEAWLTRLELIAAKK